MEKGRKKTPPCLSVAPSSSVRNHGRHQSTGGGSSLPRCARTSRSLLPSRVVTKTPPPQQYSVALWRGYVTAQFYVREQGHDDALGFSQTFRTWRLPWEDGEPMEKDPSALAALAALEADLLAQGWERMRRAPGSEWYELRFRRAKSTVRLAPERAPLGALPPEPRANASDALQDPADAQARPRASRRLPFARPS